MSGSASSSPSGSPTTSSRRSPPGRRASSGGAERGRHRPAASTCTSRSPSSARGRPSELPAILDVLASGRRRRRAARARGRRATARRAPSACSRSATTPGAATRLAARLHERARRARRLPAGEPSLAAARHRPALPRAAAAPARRCRSSAWVSSDAAAFLSRLHPSGARYEVLEFVSARRMIG